MDGTLFGPGEAESLAMGPNTITIKANSEMTAGTFFLSETSTTPTCPCGS
jgi:hypothetical protein